MHLTPSSNGTAEDLARITRDSVTLETNGTFVAEFLQRLDEPCDVVGAGRSLGTSCNGQAKIRTTRILRLGSRYKPVPPPCAEGAPHSRLTQGFSSITCKFTNFGPKGLGRRPVLERRVPFGCP
jgi:hypothetical protein